MAITDLIYEAQKSSDPVFGVDIDKLSKKVTFDAEQNDIHKLYKFVKEIAPDTKLPLDRINNYNSQFELCKECLDPDSQSFVIHYLYEALLFDYENSSFPELYYFAMMSYLLMWWFVSGSCFQTSLLSYMSLLAADILPYEEEVFHNLFLIDFSESPDIVDSIKHFRLDIKNSEARFVFKDYDTSLSETFRILTNKDEFIGFMRAIYSDDSIREINNDIVSILANL